MTSSAIRLRRAIRLGRTAALAGAATATAVALAGALGAPGASASAATLSSPAFTKAVPAQRGGAPFMRGTSSFVRGSLPSQLLFLQTRYETIDIYPLVNPNQVGSVGQIANSLVGTQYQMTVDAAGDLYVVNDNFYQYDEQYVTVYAPPYDGYPTILNGVEFPLGVAVDKFGTVYVSNCGTYCSVSPTIFIYTGGSTTPTGSIALHTGLSPGGLAIDAASNLYVVASDRATGASDVYEIASGSSTPVALNLQGLYNLGGPGIGTIAIDPAGDLYVGANSNSTYILEFKPGKTKTSRIIDPFSFFDIPGMLNYGPDGKLYVPINCQSVDTCEGDVIAFRHAGTPVESVGDSTNGIDGVATAPNAILGSTGLRSPYSRPRIAPRFGMQSLLRSGATHSASRRSGASAAPRIAASPRITAQDPFGLSHSAHGVTNQNRGWISPTTHRAPGMLYLADSGTGSSDPGEVVIYPSVGQSQLPIGVLTAGMSTPQGLATDSSGNLYVANEGNSTVTEFAPGTSTPFRTYSAALGSPLGVTVGTDGTLYVANLLGSGSYTGSVTEYPAGSTTPSLNFTNNGMYATAVALDASNNLYVAWFQFGTYVSEIDEYAPGSTVGTNLNLNLPTYSFPIYAMAFDHHGNLVLWNETLDHNTKYLMTFAPGATEPSHSLPGGSFLDIVTGIAFPRSKTQAFISAVNVNEGTLITYPKGLPLDVFGSSLPWGIALSPGT